MSRKDNKYAVAQVNILVHGMNNTRMNDQRTALLGTIVKVENILGNGNVAIRFLDKAHTSFEEATYCCKQSELVSIAESLWPLLIAIPSPITRSEIAANTSLCDQLISMNKGTKVEVLHNKLFYMGIIRYIGVVQAMGPGHIFGLELLVRSQSQVTNFDGSYAGTQYFNALPGTGLFVSLDKLKPVVTFLSTINTKYESHYPVFDSNIPEIELRNHGNSEKQRSVSVSDRISRYENEVDLIELIGGTWSGSNNFVTDKKNERIPTEQPTKVTRNKSLNIVSHLISNKKSVKVTPKSDNSNSNVNVANTEKITSNTQQNKGKSNGNNVLKSIFRLQNE